ncbi:MAG: hypothetical protein LBH42_08375, partial [Treponema sp.]|nr:hypothetical protein [Treponema sp.]
NYETKANLFTQRFRENVNYINYSAQGSFLIVALSERQGTVFINSETGQFPESGEELDGTGESQLQAAGSISFAATGQSERIMISYISSGLISYRDLVAGTELQRHNAPYNIREAVLFGNSRFLAGFDHRGLLILDAVTGETLARDETQVRGQIFIDNPLSAQFNCLSFNGEVHTVIRMEINLTGTLRTISRRNIPASLGVITCAAGDGENVFLGTGRGEVWLVNRNGERAMDTAEPERITDAAVSSSAIAFITNSGNVGYIPLDYSRLRQGDTVTLEDAEGYTNITGHESRFLFWNSKQATPMLKSLSGPPIEANTSRFLLDKLAMRFPLRSAAMLDNKILFLNTAGTVSVLDQETGDLLFTNSAAGSINAAFINQNSIIIGRSAAAGNTPFMAKNITTGETVHLPYPAFMGSHIYRSASGSIYAFALSQSDRIILSSIILLNTSNPANSEILVTYNGESPFFSMAESANNLAYSFGNGGIILRPDRKSTVPMQRSVGLPVKILSGGRWFIILDGEGGIAWHNNQTGRLEAVFRLYPLANPAQWVLERSGTFIQGKIVNK